MASGPSISSYTMRIILIGTVGWHVGAELVRIKITPEKSIATTTESVQVSCTAGIEGVGAGEITVIEVSRNDEKPLAILRHCSEMTRGTHASSRFQAVGSIDKEMGKGFLNLTLDKPTSEDTGIYTCTVYYLDQDGTMKDHKASQNMLVEGLDVKALENVLNTMKGKIAELDRKQTEMNKIVSDGHQQIMSLEETALKNNASFQTAFSATNLNSNIRITSGQILILPDIIMRRGEGYDEQTGVFTAPMDGLYAFHFVVTNSQIRSHLHVELKSSNNQVIARLFSYDGDTWGQSSMSAVAHLKAGDKVFAISASSKGTLRSGYYTVFTGYLINPF